MRRLRGKTSSPALSIRQSWWLSIASIAALVPLAPFVPYWLTGGALAAILWRAWLTWGHRALPPRWLLALLVIAGMAGVAAEYRSLFGRNPGIAMLVLFVAFKLLELRTQRDGLIVILLGLFLLLTSFCLSQSIASAALVIASLSIIIAALAGMHDKSSSTFALWQRSVLMLLQALPFMLLLFLLFPRVQGPLWGMPLDAFTASSGLSDTMSPGSIARVAQSDAIALRVNFKGALPPNNQLYWRGAVMSRFDGLTWRPGLQAELNRLPYTPTGAPVEYEVTLEANNMRWLLALELPGELPPESRMSHDFQLLYREPIRTRQRYKLRSYPDTHAGIEEAPRILREALSLPPQGNPRIRALADEWRKNAELQRSKDGGPADAAILAQAQAFFQRQLLVYTLTPPLLGSDTVDEFLFEYKRGFCEHFASAFVFALRAAGVPARVVAGYQGGEINPVDGYFIVRQADAHAWTEVWLQGRGWLRVDPTEISGSSRIERGLVDSVPAGDPLPLLTRSELAWLRELRFHWEATTNTWNQWVLGFNPQKQRELLADLGMKSPDWRSMIAMLAAFFGVLLLALGAWVLLERQNRDPLQKLWRRFNRHLEKQGVNQMTWEGAQDYSLRAAQQLPGQAGIILDIAARYIRLRYEKPQAAAMQTALLNELKVLIQSLRRYR